MYYFGNAWYWWVFWILIWICFLFLYDAGEPDCLPAMQSPLQSCKGDMPPGDHQRGYEERGPNSAGCECEIGISTWTQPAQSIVYAGMKDYQRTLLSFEAFAALASHGIVRGTKLKPFCEGLFRHWTR